MTLVSGSALPVRIEQRAAPLREQVVRQLRQAILDQTLRPGQRLTEAALCEQLEVSRTVVRESLRQLESERLITLLPNRGPIVTVLSRHEIQSLYEVRASLEGLAGALFAERASESVAAALLAHLGLMRDQFVTSDVADRGRLKDEFYRLLLEGADSPVLSTSLTGVHARVAIFRHYAFQDERRAADAVQEVTHIVHACAEERSPGNARRACEEHIARAGALAIEEYCRRVPEMP